MRPGMRALEQNLLSVVRMSRAAVPHIRRAGGGSILNITALSMLQPISRFRTVGSELGGRDGSRQDAVARTRSDRITVNTLCPGLIETPRLHLVTRQSGRAMKDLAAEIPLGRRGPGRRGRRGRRLSRLTPRRLHYRRHAPSRRRAIAQPTLMCADPIRYCNRAPPGSDYWGHLDLGGNRLRE